MTTTIITTTSAANVILANNADMERAAFMVAKTHGTINPILLGAKVAMLSELKKRLEKGEVVSFQFIKKGTGELRTANAILPKNSSFIASKIKGTGTPNSFYGNVTFWDLDRNAFRCCSYESIIRVF